MPIKTTRKSVTLTTRDLEDIAKLRGSPAGREALRELGGQDQDLTSEAQALHAVIEAGLRALRERVQDAGYAALASDTDAAERRAIARRRRPSWADEPSE